MKNVLQEHHSGSSVRSLMWSFGSPSLVISEDDTRWQVDQWFSWRALELAGLMDNPQRASDLDQFLNAEKDHRLGARYERLIEYGIEHLPDFECVKRRLQIQANKQTVGEFDFIVRSRSSGELEHWEVASKFYLGVPFTTSEESLNAEPKSSPPRLRWVGPGKRDSLNRKLRHLTQKQLVLSSFEEAGATLAGLEGPVSQIRALLKGRLFYPLRNPRKHDSQFEFCADHGSVRLNPQAPTGYWCEYSELLEAAPQSLFELPKSSWLDPKPDTSQKVEPATILERLETAPQCVDVLTKDGTFQRWFVVSEGWFDDLDPNVVD